MIPQNSPLTNDDSASLTHLWRQSVTSFICFSSSPFQLTFPKAKLLLMSSDQEDINDWYRSLSLAVGYVPSGRVRSVCPRRRQRTNS